MHPYVRSSRAHLLAAPSGHASRCQPARLCASCSLSTGANSTAQSCVRVRAISLVPSATRCSSWPFTAPFSLGFAGWFLPQLIFWLTCEVVITEPVSNIGTLSALSHSCLARILKAHLVCDRSDRRCVVNAGVWLQAGAEHTGGGPKMLCIAWDRGRAFL